MQMALAESLRTARSEDLAGLERMADRGDEDDVTFMGSYPCVGAGHGGVLTVFSAPKTEDHRIRAQQDAEYRESLRKDKERMRREEEEAKERERAKQAAAEAALREADAEVQRQKEAEDRKRALERRVRPEPPAGKDTVSIAFRLPDGTRKPRRFLGTDPVDAIFDFLELEGFGAEFAVYQNMPRKRCTREQTSIVVCAYSLIPL